MIKLRLNESIDSNNVGYKNDRLFLLSATEYRKYRNVILKLNAWWWLRSLDIYTDFTGIITDDDLISIHGGYIYSNYKYGGARPTLKVNPEEIADLNIGDETFDYLNTSFTKIDDDLLISTDILITNCMFDKKLNDYETSHARKELKKLEREL